MLCLVFVEPVAVRDQIQVGETYTNKCIRQGHTPRRRRTERRKAAAEGTHNHAKSQSQVLSSSHRELCVLITHCASRCAVTSPE